MKAICAFFLVLAGTYAVVVSTQVKVTPHNSGDKTFWLLMGIIAFIIAISLAISHSRAKAAARNREARRRRNRRMATLDIPTWE